MSPLNPPPACIRNIVAFVCKSNDTMCTYTSALQPNPPLLKQKHILMRTKHNNQAWILVASDPVTSISLHLRNMCQPSKTTSSYTPPDPHAKQLFLPLTCTHMHIRIQIHTLQYIHAQIHSHWKNQTQAVSICMQSPHQTISQWPNKWSRQRESHLHLYACALVSVLPPYTHTHACTLARCLQSKQLAVRCAEYSFSYSCPLSLSGTCDGRFFI